MLVIPLDVKISALGGVFASHIGGREVQLWLPRLNPDERLGTDLVQPHFKSIAQTVSLQPWIHESPAWGKRYHQDGSEGAASIRQVALVVPVADHATLSERQALAEGVYNAVDQWCELVLDWLEVVCEQRLRLPSVFGRPGKAIQPWLWT